MTPHEFLTLKRVISNKDNINVPSVVKWLTEYADIAIKADRINLLNHIHTKCLNTPDNSCSECEYHTIDKESLLNAPNIKFVL